MPSAARQNAPVERFEACAEDREVRGGSHGGYEPALALYMKGYGDGLAAF